MVLTTDEGETEVMFLFLVFCRSHTARERWWGPSLISELFPFNLSCSRVILWCDIGYCWLGDVREHQLLCNTRIVTPVVCDLRLCLQHGDSTVQHCLPPGNPTGLIYLLRVMP